MSLGSLSFDGITETDIEGLIEVGVPEGLNIEYKRELYGSSDKDIKENIEDISAFANSFGGHLIIGIEEAQGLLTKIVALQNINPDIEK